MTNLERVAKCQNCNDEMWVCENHPNVPWESGEATCCLRAGKRFDCGAGMPCPECNQADEDCQPQMGPGFVVLEDIDGSNLQ